MIPKSLKTVLLIGAGTMGRAVAREVLETTAARLSVCDPSAAAARRLEEELATTDRAWERRCSTLGTDDVAGCLAAMDGIILCVSWPDTRAWLERLLDVDRCLRPTTNIVSITRPDYADVNWLKALAEQCGQTVLLPMGLEPGLVELLAGAAQRAVADLSRLSTYCGGIPAVPRFPLCHSLFFGQQLAVDSRPAWYVRHGVPSLAARFEDVRRIAIEGVGILEAYHDGMMPTTAHDPRFSGLACFEQRTVRWPGFVERIVNLKELGFFSDADIDVGGTRIKRSDFTHRVLQSLLVPEKREHDLAIVQVSAERADGAEGTISLVCRGEPERSGLAQLTSIVAVAGLRVPADHAQGRWHEPTSQALLQYIPMIVERLQHVSQIDLTSSGILTNALIRRETTSAGEQG